MPLTNREMAEIFENIADMLEIKGESRFRFLSYRRAGETLGDLPRDLQAYADDGTLRDIPGVGDAIAKKIEELLQTGKLDYYEKLKADVPIELLQIKRISGVGPKKAKLFWDELNITTISQLEEAAKSGKLRQLAGMGAKSEQKIIDGIEALARNTGRTPIGKARPAAQAILDELLKLPEAYEGIIAGSIRRGRPTIGDVDILIASDNAQPIMEKVVNMARVARVLGQGETKSSVELQNGLQVDVRVLPKSRWGTALQYFTGSKNHNVQIREIARQQGFSLNEEALRPLDENGNLLPESEYIYCDNEEAVYERLGLQWIPPEIREDSGEIELAKAGQLPTLITVADIIADLHMHTTASDGTLSIREMAQAALERGRRYIVITDHSRRSVQANGLSIERLLQQQEEVRRINDEMGDDLQVLHGVEMDILEDGGMDYPDDILAQLDWVVASLHFGLTQDRDTVTQRLLNAIRNPHVDVIGHPTARLIGSREPVNADMDVVLQAAAEHQTALEINANPRRLDLDAQYVRRAVELGVLLSINSDAHKAQHMDYMDYGVMTARRGWVQPQHVINTWSFERFQNWVHERA